MRTETGGSHLTALTRLCFLLLFYVSKLADWLVKLYVYVYIHIHMDTHLPTATGLSLSPVQLTQIHWWLWKELLSTDDPILCTHTCTQIHTCKYHRFTEMGMMQEIGSVMAHIIIIPISMLDFGKSGVVDHENIITFGKNKKWQIQTTLSFLCTYTLLLFEMSA